MSQIHDCYGEWRDLENEIKLLRETQKNFLTNLAESKGEKKGRILSAFRYRKKLEDKGIDDLDSVVSLFMELNSKK